MGLIRDERSVQIGSSTVSVTGMTGPVYATWVLLVDGQEVDSAVADGEFRLRGQLSDGSDVEAVVHQSLVGPTYVLINHRGDEVTRFEGFVT
ncbi:MAG: hypothetical protein ACRDRK_17050 [Pseudonocardia sp.]